MGRLTRMQEEAAMLRIHADRMDRVPRRQAKLAARELRQRATDIELVDSIVRLAGLQALAAGESNGR